MAGKSMNTTGGDTFFISGSQFGPSLYSGIAGGIRVTYGPVGAEDAYIARVVRSTHEEIEVRTAPGTGGPHVWNVEVAGQTGELSDPELHATSYLSPDLSGVTIMASAVGGNSLSLPASGGATVLVDGSQFGPSGSSSVMAFLVLRSPGVAWGIDGSTGAGGIEIPMESCVRVAGMPHTRISCRSPIGAGTSYGVKVVIDGQMAELAMPMAGGGTVDFELPVVTAISGSGAQDAGMSGG